jgi:hypothetical protein
MNNFCQNCGRDSHCGGSATMPVNAHDVGVYEIVVCKNCRCKNCTNKKDTDNEF